MHFGWQPDYAGSSRILSTSKYPIFSMAYRSLFKDDDVPLTDTFLYKYLTWIWPQYQRGEQGIGDCVSWGTELACTLLIAQLAYRAGDREMCTAEAATEPIYGGSRVEARGMPGDGAKAYGGFQDGSYGSAAAKWVKEWGILQRHDYSSITGQLDDDLRVYNSGKAKEWGAYGCGGKNDQLRMDNLAKEHPVKEFSLCRDFNDVARSIAVLRSPVIVGSNQGFNMALDSDGFWTPSGTWYHLMVWIGVRFGDRPGALIAQSWGPNTTTRTVNRWPADMPTNIAGFTGWVDADVVTKMCRQDDAFSLLGSNFTSDNLDFSW